MPGLLFSLVRRMPNPADTYRMYAKLAADMAAEESDPRNRASLLDMAQAWKKLADRDAPSTAQQQQQPQPDGDKAE
jgi:hypothetical protein